MPSRFSAEEDKTTALPAGESKVVHLPPTRQSTKFANKYYEAARGSEKIGLAKEIK